MNRLLTVHDLAEMLSVPRSTIYAWRYRGRGPPALCIGRHLRYRQEDVEGWLAERAEVDRLRRVEPPARSGRAKKGRKPP